MIDTNAKSVVRKAEGWLKEQIKQVSRDNEMPVRCFRGLCC